MKAGEPSATARRVAAHRLGFARITTSYGDALADDRLQADVAGLEQTRISGLTRYLERRTAFFDSAVVESIEAGVQQIVMVGAGYDARSLRYAKPTIDWFELDHPQTQADKLARLRRLGIGTRGVTFIGVDFADGGVSAALRVGGYDSARSTLFACEGVAGYLSEAILRSLLTSLASCADDRGRLAISVPLVPTSTTAEALRSAIGAAVASIGEPLLTAVSRSELHELFESTGWSIVRDACDGDVGDAVSGYAFIEARTGRTHLPAGLEDRSAARERR